VAAAIDGLTWHDMYHNTLLLPMVLGLAIGHLIRELPLPGVRQIAWNGAVLVREDAERSASTYSLYGIESVDVSGPGGSRRPSRGGWVGCRASQRVG
jgi:hypothetical protein